MNDDSQNAVRTMMVFEGDNFLSISRCVSRKYAVTIPHESVLTQPEMLLRKPSRDVVSMSRPEPDLDELKRALHRILADKWGKKKVSSSRLAGGSE
jgi:hypothetical protein